MIISVPPWCPVLSQSRHTCGLIHASIVRSLFSSLVLQVIFLDFVLPDSCHLETLPALDSHKNHVRQKVAFSPTAVLQEFSTPLRHFQIHISVISLWCSCSFICHASVTSSRIIMIPHCILIIFLRTLFLNAPENHSRVVSGPTPHNSAICSRRRCRSLFAFSLDPHRSLFLSHVNPASHASLSRSQDSYFHSINFPEAAVFTHVIHFLDRVRVQFSLSQSLHEP